MPKHLAQESDARLVRAAFRRPGLRHLRVRRRSDLVTVESGPDQDPIRHARFRRDTVHLWVLEIATHTGRWEKTPYRDLLPKLTELVIDAFPWTLSRVE
jgi:hypothetical protein